MEEPEFISLGNKVYGFKFSPTRASSARLVDVSKSGFKIHNGEPYCGSEKGLAGNTLLGQAICPASMAMAIDPDMPSMILQNQPVCLKDFPGYLSWFLLCHEPKTEMMEG